MFVSCAWSGNRSCSFCVADSDRVPKDVVVVVVAAVPDCLDLGVRHPQEHPALQNGLFAVCVAVEFALVGGGPRPLQVHLGHGLVQVLLLRRS